MHTVVQPSLDMAFVTFTVDVTCCAQGLAELSPCDVLLDNQAMTASLNAELLTNIRKGKSRVRVTGISGSIETARSAICSTWYSSLSSRVASQHIVYG